MVVIVLFSAFVVYMNIQKSKANDTEIDIFDKNNVNLVIGAELIQLDNPPIVKDNEIALPLDTVMTYFDPYISWDSIDKRVTITTKDKVIRMNTGNLTAFVNNKETTLNLPAFEEDGVVYIPMKFLKDIYMIDINYIEQNNVVVIDSRNTVVQVAEIILDGAVLRNGRSKKDPIVKRLDAKISNEDESENDTEDGNEAENSSDETLLVFYHYDDWYKARATDGSIGYIEKKYVAVRMFVDKIALRDNKVDIWKPDRGKINMTWDLLGSGNPDVNSIPDMPGLDVISPTWFKLANTDGDVTSIASNEYVEWAHSKGIKVWALFDNAPGSLSIDETSEFLNNSVARENSIRSILAYSAIFGLDGINLDFERMYLSDRDVYTQFVRELAPMLREQGVLFSVDVNIPDGSDIWSKCYDSPSIAQVVDYIIVMTYDQHGASSATPGSVAQYSWVEANVKKMVERDGIPPEKLILGIPFYSRLWEVEKGNAENSGILSTKAIYMDTAINMAIENGASIIWDKSSAQFYCEFDADGKSYIMWIDEMNSINYKTSLVHKYDLAGTSSWCRIHAHPGVWEVIDRNMKVIETYRQWEEGNNLKEPLLVG